YPGVVRRLAAEAPIAPVDGLDAPGSLFDRATSTTLTLETFDPDGEEMKATKIFGMNRPLGVRAGADQDVIVEVLWQTPLKLFLLAAAAELTEGKPGILKPGTTGGEASKDQILMFAYLKTQVLSKDAYPRGVILRASRHEGVRDRFLHPTFYGIRKDG